MQTGPSTHIFLFEDRFAPLVVNATKTSTIRPPRSRTVRVGDHLDLRCWLGKPYRSQQVLLRKEICEDTRPIEIDEIRSLIWLDRPQTLLSVEEAASLAKSEGFAAVDEMVDWFAAVYGLPFTGVYHRWDPNCPF